MFDASTLTKQMLAAKRAKKMTFADFEPIVGLDEIVVAAIFYRQATPTMEQACTILETLDLPIEHAEELAIYPSKGLGPVVPTDPLIYRFYEIMQVYGYPLKDVIQEKFGDGIMSAIDFTMHIEKEENPAGDRVVLTMNGKFLPYKKW